MYLPLKSFKAYNISFCTLIESLLPHSYKNILIDLQKSNTLLFNKRIWFIIRNFMSKKKRNQQRNLRIFSLIIHDSNKMSFKTILQVFFKLFSEESMAIQKHRISNIRWLKMGLEITPEIDNGCSQSLKLLNHPKVGLFSD